jgi:hypothetical protein
MLAMDSKQSTMKSLFVFGDRQFWDPDFMNKQPVPQPFFDTCPQPDPISIPNSRGPALASVWL